MPIQTYDQYENRTVNLQFGLTPKKVWLRSFRVLESPYVHLYNIWGKYIKVETRNIW